jgi:hypothetical protein
MTTLHPLDQSLALEPRGDHLWHSPSSPLYWNAIGPFGGWIGAMLLHAVLSEPQARGDPVALQAQFIGPLRQAPFLLRTTCVRQNRTTAFWRSEILQAREEGAAEAVCAHASITLSDWRDTFTLADATMPLVPPADTLPPPPPRRTRTPAFIARYDYRMVTGPMLSGADNMNSLLWLRDTPPRTLDAIALTGLCDTPFPSLWLRRTEPVMITTLVYNIFFRTSRDGLAAAGARHVLIDSSCDVGAAGFYDQNSNVWSDAGQLLAQTQQLAWFADKPLRPL